MRPYFQNETIRVSATGNDVTSAHKPRPTPCVRTAVVSPGTSVFVFFSPLYNNTLIPTLLQSPCDNIFFVLLSFVRSAAYATATAVQLSRARVTVRSRRRRRRRPSPISRASAAVESRLRAVLLPCATRASVSTVVVAATSAAIMSEREENVYKAKLAEQAERYDGEYTRHAPYDGRYPTRSFAEFVRIVTTDPPVRKRNREAPTAGPPYEKNRIRPPGLSLLTIAVVP